MNDEGACAEVLAVLVPFEEDGGVEVVNIDTEAVGLGWERDQHLSCMGCLLSHHGTPKWPSRAKTVGLSTYHMGPPTLHETAGLTV